MFLRWYPYQDINHMALYLSLILFYDLVLIWYEIHSWLDYIHVQTYFFALQKLELRSYANVVVATVLPMPSFPRGDKPVNKRV